MSAVEQQWLDLGHSLAEALRDLDEDETLSMHVPTTGCEGEDLFGESYCDRYLQFCAYGPGWLRCEVVSNEFLCPTHAHSRREERHLVRMGWNAPRRDDPQGSPNFWVDVETVWVDFVADMVLRVLRETWRVEDPRELLLSDPHDVYVALALPASLR